MKIYRIAKSIEIPLEVDQQIRNLLNIIPDYLKKVQEHKEPYYYQISLIKFLDPYAKKSKEIPIFVSNVDAETYKVTNDFAAFLASEGMNGSIYVYRADNIQQLYRAIIHEFIHSIDPKLTNQNVMNRQKQKSYELQNHEMDAFFGTITNSIKNYLTGLKQKNDPNLTKIIESLNTWLKSSQLQYLPHPFTNIIDSAYMQTYLQDLKSLKILKQRIYQTINSISIPFPS
jgi:hypothetical protein